MNGISPNIPRRYCTVTMMMLLSSRYSWLKGSLWPISKAPPWKNTMTGSRCSLLLLWAAVELLEVWLAAGVGASEELTSVPFRGMALVLMSSLVLSSPVFSASVFAGCVWVLRFCGQIRVSHSVVNYLPWLNVTSLRFLYPFASLFWLWLHFYLCEQ